MKRSAIGIVIVAVLAVVAAFIWVPALSTTEAAEVEEAPAIIESAEAYVYIFSSDGECLIESTVKEGTSLSWRRPSEISWTDHNGETHQVYMTGGTFAYVSALRLTIKTEPVISLG